MNFDKSRVYTPFNADEVKTGSKGFVADNKTDLMTYVNRSNGQDLIELKDVDSAPGSNLPFVVGVGCNTIYYEYFYLVEEPQEPKKRLMTNQELSWWLRDCPEEHREWRNWDGTVMICYNYEECLQGKSCPTNIRIRSNGGEWKEPLVEE